MLAVPEFCTYICSVDGEALFVLNNAFKRESGAFIFNGQFLDSTRCCSLHPTCGYSLVTAPYGWEGEPHGSKSEDLP
jgi:hypothetical protein